MRARALAVHACPLARGPGPPATAPPLGSDSEAAPQSRKSRVADKKQTNQQTNTHCSFIGIDELTKVGSDQRSSTIQYDSKSKHSKRR